MGASGQTRSLASNGGTSSGVPSDHVHKQQRWLLFLRHCAKCTRADNECQYGQSCMVAKQLWRHILTCANADCSYPRHAARLLDFCLHSWCSATLAAHCGPAMAASLELKHIHSRSTSWCVTRLTRLLLSVQSLTSQTSAGAWCRASC